MHEQPPQFSPPPEQRVSGFYVALPPAEVQTGVAVADIMRWLRRKARWLVASAIAGSVAGLGLFFLIQPVYRAEVIAVAATTEQERGVLANLASQFGGLAELGGIQLGNQSSEVAEAVAVLSSRKFLGDFITREELLPVLFPEIREGAKPGAPSGDSIGVSLQDGIERFNRQIMQLSVDDSAMFVTVRIDWYDPNEAADWANGLISSLNATMRERAVLDAQRNVEYLKEELGRTEVVAIQQSVNRLVEDQMRRAMLANTRAEYVLRVIDPAIPPEDDRYIRPNWPLLIFGGALLASAFCAVLIVLFARDLRDPGRSIR